MKTHRLLIIMARYANMLIKGFHEDFTVIDTEAIKKRDSQVRFIWQVRDTGTWLYHFDEPGWEQRLLERINYYKGNNIYFYYNKKKLRLIFESDVRKIAGERIKARQKKTNKEEETCTTKS